MCDVNQQERPPVRMNYHIAPDIGSAARQIERQLRASIITMELPPGTRLSEIEFAEKFGVSRQPVREALISLARAELVSILPQRGTTVVKISADRMMQARFIREQIEAGVVRRACAVQITETDRRVLDELVRRQGEALENNDIDSFKAADERFHQNLARAAGLEIAWQTIGDIKAHLDRVCHLTLTDAQAMRPLIGQHRAILDAVVRRDADAAEAAMRFHLTEILRAMPIVMAQRADLFG
jgi:GntR family transcriptional regulator, rspAB operon transcriptional repressor